MSEYQEKLCKDLGFKHFSRLRIKLVNMLIIKMLDELGENQCFRCKQRIEIPEDLSLDHSEGWRNADTKEKSQELFWNLEKLFASHKHCNTPDHNRGKNSNGYIGVTKNVYKNTGNIQYVAELAKDSIEYKLGYSKYAKFAAFFRDIGIFKYRDGAGILNFENLREYYKTIKDREWRSFTDEELNGIFG